MQQIYDTVMGREEHSKSLKTLYKSTQGSGFVSLPFNKRQTELSNRLQIKNRQLFNATFQQKTTDLHQQKQYVPLFIHSN